MTSLAGKMDLQEMVNKAIIGRRLCFLTAETSDSSQRNHSCREYDEEMRNFLNIKVDYKSKKKNGPQTKSFYILGCGRFYNFDHETV